MQAVVMRGIVKIFAVRCNAWRKVLEQRRQPINVLRRCRLADILCQVLKNIRTHKPQLNDRCCTLNPVLSAQAVRLGTGRDGQHQGAANGLQVWCRRRSRGTSLCV